MSCARFHKPFPRKRVSGATSTGTSASAMKDVRTTTGDRALRRAATRPRGQMLIYPPGPNPAIPSVTRHAHLNRKTATGPAIGSGRNRRQPDAQALFRKRKAMGSLRALPGARVPEWSC